MNVEPRGGSLSTLSLPPFPSTILLLIARPSPAGARALGAHQPLENPVLGSHRYSLPVVPHLDEGPASLAAASDLHHAATGGEGLHRVQDDVGKGPADLRRGCADVARRGEGHRQAGHRLATRDGVFRLS